MALVKITEESLRQQAGDSVFEQALAMAAKVAALEAEGSLVEATVDGIPVSIRIGARSLDARCGCPAPAPCPHAVAVALAWVRAGEDEQVADLYETLRTLDRDWLARRLAELAATDPAASARLLAAAAQTAAAQTAAAQTAAGQTGPAAVADLRAEFAEELAALAEQARHPEPEWYPDPADLDELLDEAELLLDDAPDAVRELAEDVIDGIEQALNLGTDLTGTLARARDLLAHATDPAQARNHLSREAGQMVGGPALEPLLSH